MVTESAVASNDYIQMNTSKEARECAREMNFNATEVKDCKKRCMKSCDQSEFRALVQTVPRQNSGKFQVFIDVQHLTKSISEEYHAYTFETFISNLGGMIGLGTGMSILSLCELLFCLLCFVAEQPVRLWAWHQTRNQTGDDSAVGCQENHGVELT